MDFSNPWVMAAIAIAVLLLSKNDGPLSQVLRPILELLVGPSKPSTPQDNTAPTLIDSVRVLSELRNRCDRCGDADGVKAVDALLPSILKTK